MSRAALLATLAAACLGSACQGNAGATPAAGTASDSTLPAVLPPPAIDPPMATPSAEPASEPASVSGEAPDKPFGDRIVLQPGMTADLAPATTLAFERIVSDSRCPKDAQCIWAGEVTVAMKLVTPLGSNSFELSDRNDKVSALGYSIELLEYGLCPGGPAITPLPGECAQLMVGADPAP